jgi:hypothetical protein
MTEKLNGISLSVSVQWHFPHQLTCAVLTVVPNTRNAVTDRTPYFAMRRSGVRPPSAPPAQNPDRMGLFCASGASLPDEFWGNSSSNSSSSANSVEPIGSHLAAENLGLRAWPPEGGPATLSFVCLDTRGSARCGGLSLWVLFRMDRLTGLESDFRYFGLSLRFHFVAQSFANSQSL